MPIPEVAAQASNLGALHYLAVIAGSVLTGVLGLGGVQHIRHRRNGNGLGGADKIVTALKEEGSATRVVLHETHKETAAVLAGMRENCSVAHGVLMDRTGKPQ